MNVMTVTKSTMAQQVAQAAAAYQYRRTGHAPSAVTVVLNENTLVITMHGALSPAEQALAANPQGAAQVQEFNRQLFANSADALCEEIKRITGVDVRQSAAEVETATGTVVHAFTNGTMVQVFLLVLHVRRHNPSSAGGGFDRGGRSPVSGASPHDVKRRAQMTGCKETQRSLMKPARGPTIRRPQRAMSRIRKTTSG
jgi:uncharacterized protein YbcI